MCENCTNAIRNYSLVEWWCHPFVRVWRARSFGLLIIDNSEDLQWLYPVERVTNVLGFAKYVADVMYILNSFYKKSFLSFNFAKYDRGFQREIKSKSINILPSILKLLGISFVKIFLFKWSSFVFTLIRNIFGLSMVFLFYFVSASLVHVFILSWLKKNVA